MTGQGTLFSRLAGQFRAIRATVHRDADDPNLVVVTESFPGIATARVHANSEKLKAAMGQAGVAGPPEIWFSEDVEDVSY